MGWSNGAKTRVCYRETFHQLAGTFHSVARMFGVRLNPEYVALPAFIKACFQDGNAFVNAPKLYLKCSDKEDVYLEFDWSLWLETSAFVLGVTDETDGNTESQP